MADRDALRSDPTATPEEQGLTPGGERRQTFRTFTANGLGFVTEDELPADQWEERDALLRIATELEGLADQTDAAGRDEGPSLRADAAILRRIGQDKGNVVTWSGWRGRSSGRA